jgi:hypothetical protein
VASDEKLTNVSIDDIRLALTNASVRAAGSKQALVDLKSFSLDGGHVDTASRTVVIDRLASEGGSTMLAYADGRFPLVDAFAAGHSSKERATVHEERTENRWKYEVHAADVSTSPSHSKTAATSPPFAMT